MRHIAPICLLAAAAVLAGGCVGATDKIQKRGSSAFKWSIAKKGGDRYAVLKSKRKAPLDPAEDFSSVTFLRDLWTPFRVEARVGSRSDKQAAALEDNGIFGIELDLPGALPPTQYYGVSVRRTGGGLQAYGITHLAGGPQGNEFFAGANEIDIAVEHTGTSVIFAARRAGDIPWTLIASVPAAGQTFPVHPALGAFQVAKPGQVAFDDLRVVLRGPRPGDSTYFEGILDSVLGAGDNALSALHRMEKDAPDTATAGDEIDNAQAALTAALIALANPPMAPKKRTPEEQLERLLRAAQKKIDKAEAKKDGGKSAASVTGQLEQALRKLFAAAEVLDDLIAAEPN